LNIEDLDVVDLDSNVIDTQNINVLDSANPENATTVESA
jgi:hypothetical protein